MSPTIKIDDGDATWTADADAFRAYLAEHWMRRGTGENAVYDGDYDAMCAAISPTDDDDPDYEFTFRPDLDDGWQLTDRHGIPARL